MKNCAQTPAEYHTCHLDLVLQFRMILIRLLTSKQTDSQVVKYSLLVEEIRTITCRDGRYAMDIDMKSLNSISNHSLQQPIVPISFILLLFTTFLSVQSLLLMQKLPIGSLFL